MKKPTIYLIVISVLAIIAYVVVNQDKSSTMDPSEKEFALKSTKDVSRIILTSKSDEQAVLTLEDDVWMINGKYEARRRAMNTLLETIRRIAPLYPVSNAAHDDVVRGLVSKSVKVELFENDKKQPARVFHVGGGTVNSDGTYMLLELKNKMARRPYVVNIPGFSGYLTSRFITNEEEWRSTEVIRYQPDQIQSVQLEYPNQEQHAFTIFRNENGIVGITPPPTGEIHMEKLNSYLSLFQTRSVEAFENEYLKIDSIKMNDPFCILTITPIEGIAKQFKVYYKPVSERTKFKADVNNMPMEYDIDRYFVSFNNEKDFGILQYYVFGPIFRKRSDFLR